MGKREEVDELMGWWVESMSWWVDGLKGSNVHYLGWRELDGMMGCIDELMGWWVDRWVDGLMSWWVDSMSWWVEWEVRSLIWHALGQRPGEFLHGLELLEIKKLYFYKVWSFWCSKSLISVRFGASGAQKALFSIRFGASGTSKWLMRFKHFKKVFSWRIFP